MGKENITRINHTMKKVKCFAVSLAALFGASLIFASCGLSLIHI